MENNRGSWSSNVGFLMAAIGSAVGLGNIWGFPYKMGRSGGFNFLVIYLALAVLVGFSGMISELAMGRKTGQGVIGSYNTLSKKFKWVGWLGIFAPFVIMSFYSVLGGYCMQYLALNLSNLSFNTVGLSGGESFGAMLTNPLGSAIFTLAFLGICVLIVKGGISGGIEKFNKIGMPALFIMLVIVIICSLSLPNAIEGIKYMFVPGYAVKAGFISAEPSFLTVLATAGGQMFFSMSLAMGVMFTYGSYLSKHESLPKNCTVIIIADTIVAIMAGLAVIPAAVGNGISSGIPLNEIQLGGPNLLFVTLQDVFTSMGSVGALFGVIFYTLVLVAAISSAISLVEVIVTLVLDRKAIAAEKVALKTSKPVVLSNGKSSRLKTTYIVIGLITIEALLVAVDGLGSNGVWVPFKEMAATTLADGTIQYAAWNDSWLSLMSCLSEGIAMPIGALLMSIMVGWELKPQMIIDEIEADGKPFKMRHFYSFLIRFIVPIGMLLVLLGQLDGFFALGLF